MTAQDIADYANEGELNQLDIQTPQLLRFINLAVVELHVRFRLQVQEALVSTTIHNSLYTIPAADLSQVLSVTDMYGLPCIMNDYGYTQAMTLAKSSSLYSDVIYSDSSIHTPSYNQIQVVPAVDGTFSVIYSAIPARITALTDILPVPEIMAEALLHYIGYRAHSSYDADIKTENNTHYMRFEASCKKLKDLGYVPVTAVDVINTKDKGYL